MRGEVVPFSVRNLSIHYIWIRINEKRKLDHQEVELAQCELRNIAP